MAQIDASTDYRRLAPQALGTIKKMNDGIARRNACDHSVIKQYQEAGR